MRPRICAVQKRLLAVFACLLATAGHGYAQVSAKCIYSEYDKIVGVVEAYPPVEGDPVATGFTVSAQGHFVTAAPALWKANEKMPLRVRFGGSNGPVVAAGRIESDDHLMLLQLEKKAEPYPTATLGSEPLASVGDSLFAIGYPKGFDLTIFVGGALTSRNAFVQSTLTTWWQTNIEIMAGMNGAPVFDVGGRVVGVAIKGHDEFARVGYVLPLASADTILDKAGAVYKDTGPCSEITPAENATVSDESTAGACRDPSHGVEKWNEVQEVSRESGWIPEELDAEKWCALVQNSISKNYKLPQFEVLETERRMRRNGDVVLYLYSCKLRVQSNPSYLLKLSSACGN
ncbi:MAG: serine protease [Mesorhizobium sp.]|nr:MAG: serine protease [Mesorhizobium sp.]